MFFCTRTSLSPHLVHVVQSIHAMSNALFNALGDMVLLASGSAVPADCRVNEGEIEVDEAALTGESLPVAMFKGACIPAFLSSFYVWMYVCMEVSVYVCMYELG